MRITSINFINPDDVLNNPEHIPRKQKRKNRKGLEDNGTIYGITDRV